MIWDLWVIVIGSSLNAQFGVRTSCTGATCFDIKGNYGTVNTVSVASGTDAGVSASCVISVFPTLDNIEQLNGGGVEIGGSVSGEPIGLPFGVGMSSSTIKDADTGKIYIGGSISVSVGVTVSPVDVYTQYSYSNVIKEGDALDKVADIIKKY